MKLRDLKPGTVFMLTVNTYNRLNKFALSRCLYERNIGTKSIVWIWVANSSQKVHRLSLGNNTLVKEILKEHYVQKLIDVLFKSGLYTDYYVKDEEIDFR